MLKTTDMLNILNLQRKLFESRDMLRMLNLEQHLVRGFEHLLERQNQEKSKKNTKALLNIYRGMLKMLNFSGRLWAGNIPSKSPQKVQHV